MFEFLQHNWEIFFGFVSGGGLLSFLTAKWTKMSAQANAMKEWQGVYQETIKDLRGDKDLLKFEISDLRIIVEKNTHDIEELKGYECVLIDCAMRKRRPRKRSTPKDDKSDSEIASPED